MSQLPRNLKLTYNPFEPAATGPPLSGAPLFIPDTIRDRTNGLVETLQTGTGIKALVVEGEYGSGKTCLLRWLERDVFPQKKIRSFYFDNPGVQFYDLANRLLRTIGRKDFAKFIWELSSSHLTGYQPSLFHSGYEKYLSAWSRRQRSSDVIRPLQDGIMKAAVTPDEQIAHCLARIVTDVVRKPYFEYRDFVPRQKGSVVPEGEEAPYFRAILKTIEKGMNARGTAFVIDEFEEIGLQKRLTRRAAHDYLATLKRLVNLTHAEGLEFWLVLSMTPDAYATTQSLDPSLVERVSGNRIEITGLPWSEARSLILSRVIAARGSTFESNSDSLFPFPDGEPPFRSTTYSNPRKLVKVCFRAIAKAKGNTPIPFAEAYLRKMEDELYPQADDGGGAP